MAGSIRRRGKESWEVALDMGRDPATGRSRRRFLSIKGRRRDGEAALAKALHERDSGTALSPTKLTVADLLYRWLRDYAAHNVAPSTLERYQGVVKHHLIPALGGLRLRDPRPGHIQEASGRALDPGGRADSGTGGLSPGTVLDHHRLLHEALSHAVEWQLLARHPAGAVKPPRPQRAEMRVLDAEEAAQLLEAASGTVFYPLIYLALATGARQGELLALRWADIDLDRGTLHISRSVCRLRGYGGTFRETKARRSRRPVALSADTVAILRDHRRVQVEHRLAVGPAYVDQGLVFAGPTGRHRSAGDTSGAPSRGLPSRQESPRSASMTCATARPRSCCGPASIRRWSPSAWATSRWRLLRTSTATSFPTFIGTLPRRWTAFSGPG